MLGFFKKKEIVIGDNKLVLDVSNPHELKYFKSIENDDFYISRAIVKNGYKVLDLGANIGFTSLLYLKFGAKEVYAVEPIPVLAKRIKKIKTDKIKLFDFGISDKNGIENIYLSTTHNQGHSLNDEWPKRFSNVFEKLKKIKIKVASLDSLFDNEVFDFIKIDIEGNEEKAILGGSEFFTRNKDAVVQIEIYEWQFERTNELLSKYFAKVFVPVIGSDKEVEFVKYDSNKSFKDYFVNRPPNFIYSNKEI
ncbi:FkbM family methyltransferase [Pontimicrobium sp. IMCC45349]|uniref:FkbM family methyltransferase n=1 Tax=Pontimicrobium sp. IMCC45349 TaxID=3391574 RepID=UPI0039A30227